MSNMPFEDFLDDGGDLEYGAVRAGTDILSYGRKPRLAKEFMNAIRNVIEAVQDDSQPFLRDPLRVVTLLRHCRAVSLDDYRQAKLQGFADAPGSGLTNEEICERHVMRHIRRETLDAHGLIDRSEERRVGKEC